MNQLLFSKKTKEPTLCPGGCGQTPAGCKCKEIDNAISSGNIKFTNIRNSDKQTINDYLNKR